MVDSSYYLPTELVIGILLRLPVKTLIRCTSICKSWYAIIRNANFVASHFNSNGNYRQEYHDDGYLLFGGSNFCHIVCDRTFKLMHANEPPFAVRPHRSSSLNFVGSCNGLLCFAPRLEYNLGNDMYIWNPSIRTPKKLLPSQFFDEFTDDRWIVSSLGFGYGGGREGECGGEVEMAKWARPGLARNHRGTGTDRDRLRDRRL
ncbi:F-box protein CPR1-like [Cynara cardunculus var. scolymus]|uniref:F-box protein CPR1-like n=1 Tax=Cynara cardunculus var. scolymus TaxID=59895 RepID=UPI000D628751|nr:F-box protein CPR1-like [Cynara cardunculus var. scolymus]